MPNNKMFMSPRSDLTIRNLTAEQVEAISNAAVDIVGGVVSFSESAIYESEDTAKEKPPWALCPHLSPHTRHSWSTESKEYRCPGRADLASEVRVFTTCSYSKPHSAHGWTEGYCPGRPGKTLG